MLHRKTATFESGRTDNLLKLKPHMDAEAKVIAILNGAGKYDGMMGSILVEMPSGIQFKIGSGFSDDERRNPPQPGDYVTYKYHGFTERGIQDLPVFCGFEKSIINVFEEVIVLTEVYCLPGTMCDQRLWDTTQQALGSHIALRHVAIPSEDSCVNGRSPRAVLPTTPINLLGFSMGGYIACAFALAYPERINRLMVLSNTASGLLRVRASAT